MARTTNHSQKDKRPKYTDVPVARATSLMQKVEELKLGKFAECDPLRLPEKRWRCLRFSGNYWYLHYAGDEDLVDF